MDSDWEDVEDVHVEDVDNYEDLMPDMPDPVYESDDDDDETDYESDDSGVQFQTAMCTRNGLVVERIKGVSQFNPGLQGGVLRYYCKFEDSDDHNWELATDLINCQSLIDEHMALQAAATAAGEVEWTPERILRVGTEGNLANFYFVKYEHWPVEDAAWESQSYIEAEFPQLVIDFEMSQS